MRFLGYIMPAALALLAFSCTVEEGGSVVPSPDHISVSTEQCTRVQLSDEMKTVWTEGDLLSVFRLSDANSCWRFTSMRRTAA